MCVLKPRPATADDIFAPVSLGNQNLVTHSEQRALSFLANDPTPGAVLSSYRLGDAVPGATGRHTFGGDYRWSGPDYELREQRAWHLLHGDMSAAAARRFVLASGVRFVIADCGEPVNLSRIVSSLKLTVRHFGCATVYEVG